MTSPQFSYYYQAHIPAPGNPPQLGNPTDGGSSPPGYPHKLGDIFHSEAIVVEPPKYFQYLSGNLTPAGTTTPQPYLDFASRNAKRRRVIYVGSNDGFLHAFDAGVFNGDTTNLTKTSTSGQAASSSPTAARGVPRRQVPVAVTSRRSRSISWTARWLRRRVHRS